MRGVAREAEISVAYLSKIEHDEANPTVEVLQKLALVLDMRLDELTYGISTNELSLVLPESLEEFIEEYQEKFDELKDPDWQRMLTGVKLRGRYPESTDDWLSIFMDVRRALKKD